MWQRCVAATLFQRPSQVSHTDVMNYDVSLQDLLRPCVRSWCGGRLSTRVAHGKERVFSVAGPLWIFGGIKFVNKLFILNY